MMASKPDSSVHFFVLKRVPMLSSSQQYTVAPLRVSACIPKSLAFFNVSAEGPAGFCAAGVSVGAGAADSAGGVPAGGPGGCWACAVAAITAIATATHLKIDPFTLAPRLDLR